MHVCTRRLELHFPAQGGLTFRTNSSFLFCRDVVLVGKSDQAAWWRALWNDLSSAPRIGTTKKSFAGIKARRTRLDVGDEKKGQWWRARAQISPVSEARSLPSPTLRAIHQICWCLRCSLCARGGRHKTHNHVNMKPNSPHFLYTPMNAISCWTRARVWHSIELFDG